MDALSKVIHEFTKFVELVINTFGPTGTITIFLIATSIVYCWRLFNDRRKNKYTDLLIEDKTIQRLAEQERNLRIAYFKQIGWTDEQIEQFIMKNEFKNPIEARNHLEGRKKK